MGTDTKPTRGLRFWLRGARRVPFDTDPDPGVPVAGREPALEHRSAASPEGSSSSACTSATSWAGTLAASSRETFASYSDEKFP